MRSPVLLASLLTLIVLPPLAHRAWSEQVVLDGFVRDFAAGTMGGIRKVIRYERTRPDRSDTAIIFLADADAGGLPQEIEVQDPTGDQVHPADSQGADCVLEQTALVHQNNVVALVDAVRVFDAATMRAGYSAAARFDLQVYRLQQGDDPTDPGLVFKPFGKPLRTDPLCSAASVRQAVASVTRTIR